MRNAKILTGRLVVGELALVGICKPQDHVVYVTDV